MSMDWDRVYEECRKTRKPGDASYQAWRRACRRVAENVREDWQWLADALEDEDKKWFVASVFAKQPVPRRLFRAFLLAAVRESDASLDRMFIEPCVRSYGARRVAEVLLEHLKAGSSREKAGAAKASYWCWALRNESLRGEEDLTGVYSEFQRVALLEFIGNEDLQMRREMLPRLDLHPEKAAPERAALVERAIAIAREHRLLP